MSPDPELGPWLGVVASPRPRPAPGLVPLDDIRLTLVSRLLEEAHRSSPDWLAAWHDAVRAATARTTEVLVRRAADAATASRAPEGVAREAKPGEGDLRILAARIGSAGIPLEGVVSSLPTGGEPGPPFSRIGGAVEDSWLELERVVGSTAAEWSRRAAAVEAWQRPTAPLWMASGGLLLLAALLGLVLGGHLPAPAWFDPVIDWWWSLPWP
jgi:hypothetical protein